MPADNELLSNLLMELRRGTLILSVLSQLGEPKYGYSLVQNLTQRGVEIEPNTLYPLLRRLENQGLLESRWETAGQRPRKYYQRTKDGTLIYRELKSEWETLCSGVGNLLEEES